MTFEPRVIVMPPLVHLADLADLADRARGRAAPPFASGICATLTTTDGPAVGTT